MKCYGDFLRAVTEWAQVTGWPIMNATDIYKAAESAGFTRAEIIKHYARYRVEVRP